MCILNDFFKGSSLEIWAFECSEGIKKSFSGMKAQLGCEHFRVQTLLSPCEEQMDLNMNE